MARLHLVGKALRPPGSLCRGHIRLLTVEACAPAAPPSWRPHSSHGLCPISFYPDPPKPSPDIVLSSLITPVPCHSPFCPTHQVDLMHCHLSGGVGSWVSLSHLLDYELLGRWRDSTYPPDVALSSSRMPVTVPPSIHSLTHSADTLVLSAC